MIATQEEIRAIRRALSDLTEVIASNMIVHTSETIQSLEEAYEVLDYAIIVKPKE